MRTKIVQIEEGCEYSISPLTVDQVQELVFSEDVTNALGEGGLAAAKAVVEGNKDYVRKRCAPIVAASFNNLAMGHGEWFARTEEMRWIEPRERAVDGAASKDSSAWWTPQRISSRLDWMELTTLYKEIVEFTGLKAKLETKRASEVAPSPGESSAAAISSTVS